METEVARKEPMQTAKEMTLTPNINDIENHLLWLTAPARGKYDDAKIEIAWQRPYEEGIRSARLFPIDQISDAARLAASKNKLGANVYVGASLKQPDSDDNARCSGEDFYVATAVPIDIDHDYDAVRRRMAEIVEDQLTVITGTIPERRSQHWVRLLEPCENAEEYQEAFAALVLHVGADAKVKDSARVMRLAGTISYPSERKVAKGYQIELTRLFANTGAAPVSIERLAHLEPIALPPPEPGAPRSTLPALPGQEIARGLFDRVADGRETYWRNIVFAHIIDYQKEHGCDPDAQEVFDHAFGVFQAKADTSDGRWTSPRGQRELMKRVRNTLRRLQIGQLGKFGLASVETGAGEDERSSFEKTRKLAAPVAPVAPPPATEETETEAVSHETAPSRNKLILTWDELPDDDLEWLVEGILPANAFVSVYGTPGHYKSFLAQYLAMMVANGTPAFGKAVTQGNVLYIALEGQRGIKGRFGAMRGHYQVPFEAIRYVTRPRDFQTSASDAQELMEEVGEDGIPYSLIVIDTLARAFGGGDENAAQDMNKFISIVDAMRQATGATVLVIHHSGKDSAKGMRGSTALLGAVDAEILAKKHGKAGTAKITKMKDGEDGQVMSFRMIEAPTGLKFKTSLVLEPDTKPVDALDEEEAASAPPARRSDPRGTNERLALAALRKAFEDGDAEKVHLKDYGNVTCIHWDVWIRRCEMEPISGDVAWRRKQRAERACSSLVAGGFVLHAQRYVWERP
jgi:AAA domain